MKQPLNKSKPSIKCIKSPNKLYKKLNQVVTCSTTDNLKVKAPIMSP